MSHDEEVKLFELLELNPPRVVVTMRDPRWRKYHALAWVTRTEPAVIHVNGGVRYFVALEFPVHSAQFHGFLVYSQGDCWR